jgi:pimeloyl-ACP methyl ester carboxylesterase
MTPRWILVLVCVAAAALAMSCATEQRDEDGDDGGFPAIDVTWSPCSLEEDANDGLAECGVAQVPLFWEGDERTIEVAAKRWKADGESAGQLWLLQGGPGASGMMTFAWLMKILRGVVPEFDLYTIDHRGTGYSSRLVCPEQESEDSDGEAYLTMDEIDDCIAYLGETYGDALDGYSTTQAAHDLAGFIVATREAGKPVFVWGGSYGTYLGQRYLLLHPDQADGAILDSIHAASKPAIQASEWRNENGKALLARCDEDPFCAAKLPDSWSVLEDLYAKLETGHCPQLGIDHTTLAYLLGWLAWYSPLNAAVPAVIHRLDRCDPADMDAIVYMWNHVFGGTGDLLGITGGWWSQVLNLQIGYSDLYWGPGFEGVDLDAYFDRLLDEVLVGDIQTRAGYELYLKWPRYDEPRARELPATRIPVLMLQGALDGATPLVQAEELGAALAGPHQSFLVFPNSAHGVGNDSWVSEDSSVTTCGMAILKNFLRDPEADLDVSCIEETIPPDFAGTPALADYLFGTTDLWENAETRASVPGRPVHPIRVPHDRLPRL